MCTLTHTPHTVLSMHSRTAISCCEPCIKKREKWPSVQPRSVSIAGRRRGERQRGERKTQTFNRVTSEKPETLSYASYSLGYSLPRRSQSQPVPPEINHILQHTGLLSALSRPSHQQCRVCIATPSEVGWLVQPQTWRGRHQGTLTFKVCQEAFDHSRWQRCLWQILIRIAGVRYRSVVQTQETLAW